MSVTADLFRRAGAACIAAEPHRTPEQDWPCPACLHRLAVASTPSVGAARLLTGGVDGAAGVERPPACAGGSTSAMNNPQEGQLLGAESGPVRPHKEGTR